MMQGRLIKLLWIVISLFVFYSKTHNYLYSNEVGMQVAYGRVRRKTSAATEYVCRKVVY